MSLLLVFGITLTAFLLVVAGMAVGVMMGRREISGSCGGLANSRDGDGNTSCSLCSNPDAACRELGNRMQGPGAASDTGASPLGSPASAERGACDQHEHPVHSSGNPREKDCASEGCSKEAVEACKSR